MAAGLIAAAASGLHKKNGRIKYDWRAASRDAAWALVGGGLGRVASGAWRQGTAAWKANRAGFHASLQGESGRTVSRMKPLLNKKATFINTNKNIVYNGLLLGVSQAYSGYRSRR